VALHVLFKLARALKEFLLFVIDLAIIFAKLAYFVF